MPAWNHSPAAAFNGAIDFNHPFSASVNPNERSPFGNRIRGTHGPGGNGRCVKPPSWARREALGTRGSVNPLFTKAGRKSKVEHASSIRPNDPGQPGAQSGDDQTQQRQGKRFPGGLEIQQHKNPIGQRYEQAPQEPPNAPAVGHRQEPDLPIQAQSDAHSQQRVADRYHSRALLCRDARVMLWHSVARLAAVGKPDATTQHARRPPTSLPLSEPGGVLAAACAYYPDPNPARHACIDSGPTACILLILLILSKTSPPLPACSPEFFPQPSTASKPTPRKSKSIPVGVTPLS